MGLVLVLIWCGYGMGGHCAVEFDVLNGDVCVVLRLSAGRDYGMPLVQEVVAFCGLLLPLRRGVADLLLAADSECTSAVDWLGCQHHSYHS